MDSTHSIGMFLVALSACLLAAHWQQWRDSDVGGERSDRLRRHIRDLLRRRTVASSLVGVVGVTLMAFDTVPQTPLSITSYLLALVLMTCWILWLACIDIFANRRFQHEQNLDQIASELRRVTGNGDSQQRDR